MYSSECLSLLGREFHDWGVSFFFFFIIIFSWGIDEKRVRLLARQIKVKHHLCHCPWAFWLRFSCFFFLISLRRHWVSNQESICKIMTFVGMIMTIQYGYFLWVIATFPLIATERSHWVLIPREVLQITKMFFHILC